LKDADFTDADLTGANFQNAVMTGADLSSAILKDADFTDADLTGAIFNSASLEGAIFDKADLSRASFLFAKNVNKAYFDNAKNIDEAYGLPDDTLKQIRDVRNVSRVMKGTYSNQTKSNKNIKKHQSIPSDIIYNIQSYLVEPSVATKYRPPVVKLPEPVAAANKSKSKSSTIAPKNRNTKKNKRMK
jgi:hypothetical protein